MTKSQRLTNSAGSVVSTVELDPWGGETNRSSNQALQPHRYTTYERDANGGDEAMFRRYEGQWQRFAQPDPHDGSYDLSNPQSLNRYGYVQNDPVNFVDPSGLGDEPIDDIIIINVQDDVLVINHSEPNLSAYYAFLRESQRLFWNSMQRQAGEDMGGLRNGGGSASSPKKEKNKYLSKSCDELQNLIEQFINGEKAPGSSKGLRDRFPEQIYGNNGPGTESWKRHEDEINKKLTSLRKALEALDENKCGPPNTRGADSWSRRSAPSSSEWRGGRTFYMDTGPLPISPPQGTPRPRPCIFGPCVIS